MVLPIPNDYKEVAFRIRTLTEIDMSNCQQVSNRCTPVISHRQWLLDQSTRATLDLKKYLVIRGEPFRKEGNLIEHSVFFKEK